MTEESFTWGEMKEAKTRLYDGVPPRTAKEREIMKSMAVVINTSTGSNFTVHEAECLIIGPQKA